MTAAPVLEGEPTPIGGRIRAGRPRRLITLAVVRRDGRPVYRRAGRWTQRMLGPHIAVPRHVGDAGFWLLDRRGRRQSGRARRARPASWISRREIEPSLDGNLRGRLGRSWPDFHGQGVWQARPCASFSTGPEPAPPDDAAKLHHRRGESSRRCGSPRSSASAAAVPEIIRGNSLAPPPAKRLLGSRLRRLIRHDEPAATGKTAETLPLWHPDFACNPVPSDGPHSRMTAQYGIMVKRAGAAGSPLEETTCRSMSKSIP